MISACLGIYDLAPYYVILYNEVKEAYKQLDVCKSFC